MRVLMTTPGWCVLSRNMKRFQGGLVFKAQRLWYHSTLGSRVTKKKKKKKKKVYVLTRESNPCTLSSSPTSLLLPCRRLTLSHTKCF